MHTTYLKCIKTIAWIAFIWLLAFLVVWNRTGTPEQSETNIFAKPKAQSSLSDKLSAMQKEINIAGLKRKYILRGLEKGDKLREPIANSKVVGANNRNAVDENEEIDDLENQENDAEKRNEMVEEGDLKDEIDEETISETSTTNHDHESDNDNLETDESIDKIYEPKNHAIPKEDLDVFEEVEETTLQDQNPATSFRNNSVARVATRAQIKPAKLGPKRRLNSYLTWQTNELDGHNLPQRYVKLKQNIRRVCDSNDLNVPDEQTFFASMDTSHILVHENLRIIWCMVPKSGSTLWRKILTGLTTKVYDVPSVTNLPTTFSQTSRYLYSYTPERAAEMLRSFPKFMFTRHPFERLHSAYIDKILGSNNYIVNSIHEEIKSVLKLESLLAEHKTGSVKGGGRYKRDLTTDFDSEELTLAPGGASNSPEAGPDFEREDKPLTFPQFLHYVTKHDHYFPTEPMNGHWQPSYNMCMPCTVAYDFIGRLEDMATDGPALFNMFRIDRRMKFPTNHKPNHSFRKRSQTKTMFRALPPPLYEKLYEVYAHDFEMFNYTDESYKANGDVYYNFDEVTTILEEGKIEEKTVLNIDSEKEEEK